MQNGTISAVLAGTAALTKTTAGEVLLSGTNQYSGLTTVNDGKLTLGVNSAIFGTSNVVVNGGELAIGATTQSVGTVTLVGGVISGTTGSLTGGSYLVQSGTISAVLAGTAALTKTTAGEVLLSG